MLETAACVRVWLMGPFLVERRTRDGNWEPVASTVWDKAAYARLLLKRLLSAPARRVDRSTLIEDLWPHLASSESVERYPGDAAYQLRKVLGIPELLKTFGSNSGYELAGQNAIWLDIDAAEALLKEAEQPGRATLAALPLLEQAHRYFQHGEALEGQAGTWCHARRATVERLRYRCRIWLAQAYEQQGYSGQAELLYSRLLEDDPADEDALCLLLTLLHRQGLNGQARRSYQQTRQQVQEMGLSLSPTTEQFVKRLLEQPRLLERLEDTSQKPAFRNVLLASIQEKKYISAEDRAELHMACSESIRAAWRLFGTAGTPQVLALGQSQLHLIQYMHSALYPTIRPLFYSAIYRLIGASLFFLSDYAEAMEAHKRSYLAAVEACDPWNMAESLGWQAGVLKACGRHEESIQAIGAALRLTEGSDEPYILASRARLFAYWAEGAALMHDPITAAEKLSISAQLLDRFTANEEFDLATWQYYQATCAFYNGNFSAAEIYFKQTWQSTRPDQVQQCASIALFQAKVRLELGERDSSLRAARTALAFVAIANSSLLSQGFLDYLTTLKKLFADNREVKDFVAEVQQLVQLPSPGTVPSYLEATL